MHRRPPARPTLYSGEVSDAAPRETSADQATRTSGVGNDAGGETVLYSERLRVPVWYWVAAIGVAAILSAEVHMGSPGVMAWLPYVVLVPFAIWVVTYLGRMRVEVTEQNGERMLHAGKARLPASVIDRVAVVPGTAKSAALGRQLDPSAFVQHRSWVKPMVLVVLDDENDPTPYWLVSTRNPDAVAAALTPQPPTS
ncbi:DUF3093 domain-containing protein [Rhodococcus sp. BP-349]|nr:DUF3093 domain-containing protein [Rhodococcus sp. BP-363]MBY6544918.1 DUF3093 domain-containing protein [Rhodococcus sp. BP-369]MBY6564148.1 DUF3093 domain-containing protein [Rhodococcus sp. BP-370]MBY6578915.1 DUF3093 domain-containing protein [Rhodococcus sp. BP-364]MBY6588216.1 DUF3093 domain-containing protein [Rhodococcus sp. BP-358]MBY6592553.1 DUF3093 domain-containing protein [Rhodococcus sp. BP-362]MBY6596415.1 DUF3093 domain-containing protein [Rhodococcus sp. BP-359]MBY660075